MSCRGGLHVVYIIDILNLEVWTFHGTNVLLIIGLEIRFNRWPSARAAKGREGKRLPFYRLADVLSTQL